MPRAVFGRCAAASAAAAVADRGPRRLDRRARAGGTAHAAGNLVGDAVRLTPAVPDAAGDPRVSDAATGARPRMARGAAAALLAVALAAPLPAHAQTEHKVPDNWSLRPDGAADGEAFRLLFVSSTGVTSGSRNIDHYNDFVQAAAAAGHADIQPYADGFRALGSTGLTSTNPVNARANTSTRGADTDAAVYWVDATTTRAAVATGYADFWDGNWGNRGGRDETGAERRLTFPDPVVTGTTLNGATDPGKPLGTQDTSDAVRSWYVSGGTLRESSVLPTSAKSMFGLSPIFQAAGPNNFKLYALAVVDGAGGAVGLVPGFATDTTEYSGASGYHRATVHATPLSSAATVEYLDADDAPIADLDGAADGLQIDLTPGVNTVKVKVTRGDGTATRTYTLALTGTDPVMVSNFGSTATPRSGLWRAQRFTTGSNPAGYRVVSVSAELESVGANANSGDTHLTVWSHDGGPDDGGPDERVGALVSPSTLESDSVNTFTAEALFLDPGTDYWLLANRGLSGGARVPVLLRRDAAETTEYGWSIADSAVTATDAQFASTGTTPRVLTMRVEGHELEPACGVDLGGRTEIWSGELTPGDDPGTRGYGYSAAGGWGELSDVDFDFGSTTGAVVARILVGGNQALILETDVPAADHAPLRLHVCGDVFDLADAPATGRGVHVWDDTGLDWAVARAVPLALSASPDATLTGLAVNAGTLVPAFAPDVLDYAATVPHGTGGVTVLHTVADRGTRVVFLDGGGAELDDADDAAAGHQVDLADGAATVQLQVTAGDRQTTRTYTLTVSQDAELEIADSWSLIPDAVVAGGRFRLLFVSSVETSPLSTVIADYNHSVQVAAAAGHPDIRPYADGFTVVGSTSAVNARANTLTRATDADAPIYWVDASQTRSAVADGYADFYDGRWGGGGARNEAGTSISSGFVDRVIPTGTNLDGTTATGNTFGSAQVEGWYDLSGQLSQERILAGILGHLLGLSPVLRVAGASSAGLTSLAVADASGNVVSLDPGFAPGTTEYAAAVGTRRATVEALPASSAATVEYLDADDAAIPDLDGAAAGHQFDLEPRRQHRQGEGHGRRRQRRGNLHGVPDPHRSGVGRQLRVRYCGPT